MRDDAHRFVIQTGKDLVEGTIHLDGVALEEPAAAADEESVTWSNYRLLSLDFKQLKIKDFFSVIPINIF